MHFQPGNFTGWGSEGGSASRKCDAVFFSFLFKSVKEIRFMNLRLMQLLIFLPSAQHITGDWVGLSDSNEDMNA